MNVIVVEKRMVAQLCSKDPDKALLPGHAAQIDTVLVGRACAGEKLAPNHCANAAASAAMARIPASAGAWATAELPAHVKTPSTAVP